MKKKIIALFLSFVLMVTGCGTANSQEDTSKETQKTENISKEESTESSTGDAISDLESLGEIEVDEKLFSVELTIPADIVGETTQEELDATAAENGFKSITLNEDGSATYIMTKKQHEDLLNNLKTEFNKTFSEMAESENCPNITKIETNDNFSEFTVTINANELSMNDSMIVFSFYMAAGIYNVYSGEQIDNVHVEYVNATTGEIISSSDSSSMGE